MRNPRTLTHALALMACFAFGAFAQDTLQLVNAGSGAIMGGVYTSPYGVSINGSAPVLLICDDFNTEVSLGQTWTAVETTLAQLQAGTNPSGTPAFFPTVTPSVIFNYATAAVLAQQLMSLSDLTSQTAGELSYAIWGVFDPGLLTSNPTSVYGDLTDTQQAAAQQFLLDAQGVVTNATNASTGEINLSQIPSLIIYTPDPLFSSTGVHTSQEFLMVSMAEPFYPGVLAVDLLAFIGLAFIFRRRIAGLVH